MSDDVLGLGFRVGGVHHSPETVQWRSRGQNEPVEWAGILQWHRTAAPRGFPKSLRETRFGGGRARKGTVKEK